LLGQNSRQTLLDGPLPAVRGSTQGGNFPARAVAQMSEAQSCGARPEHFRSAGGQPSRKFGRAKRWVQLECSGGELGQQALERAIDTRRDFPDTF